LPSRESPETDRTAAFLYNKMNDHAHDQIRELLPAHALHTLDDDQALEVERHLAVCAACRQELEAYRSVSDSLSLAVPAASPSAGLKNRILKQATGSSEGRADALPGERTYAGPRWRRTRALQWATGWQAVALLAILVLGAANAVLWYRLSQAEKRAQNPGLVLMQGTDADPDALGFIVVTGTGSSATLIVENLGQLGPEQQYQLWLIDEGVRTSGGVFSVDLNGYSSILISAPAPIWDYSAFGITIEPWGGSLGPTGPRVLEYNL